MKRTKMGERVFLTGGRGFLGRRLLEALESRGFEVIALGRPEFDLMDFNSTLRALQRCRPRIVVHSAAYYGGLGINIHEPANLFHRNVLMAVNLLEACARVGVERFVSIGSACAYPADVSGDMREEDYWSGPLHPSVEAYGFSKKVQIVGVNAYKKQYGMSGLFPQLANLYGEHDVFSEYRAHVVSAMIKRYVDAVLRGEKRIVNWGTGNPIREFMYVGDAAEAVARLIDSGYEGLINVGTGIGTTIRELASLIARHAGFDGEVVWDTSKPDGVMRKVLDVSKMVKVLGWRPPTSLDEGIRRTVEWYMKNKEIADARE